MSDYLGRLAARTVAPRGTIRPRVASAFEPPLEQETFVIAPRVEAAPAPVSVPVQSAAAAPPFSGRGEATAGAELPTGRPSSLAPAGDAMPQQPMLVERKPVHQEREPVREEQVHVQEHVHEPVHEQLHEPVHERVRDRVQVRNRIHHREHHRDHDRGRIIEEHTHSVSAASPPIEITIGRIDVRAVVAAPPQKPQPKRPPIQSLEEYVAKRDGGGR